MLYLCFSMLVLFYILFFVASKKEYVKWAGIVALAGAFWAFGGFLSMDVLSQIDIKEYPDPYNIIRYIRNVFLFLGFCCWPYAYLLFAMHYSGIFACTFEKYKLKVTILLAFLPFCSLIIVPLLWPIYHMPFRVILLWVLPASIIANFLFVYTLIVEKNRKIKIHKFLMFLLNVPFAIFHIVINYITPAYGIPSVWVISPWILIILVLLIIISSTQISILGFRLKVEKETYFNSAKSLASVLNHSLKDKVNPILLIVENIKSINSDQSINTYLNEISSLAVNINDIIERISIKTKEIILQEENVNVGNAIDDAVSMVTPNLKGKSLVFTKDIRCDAVLLCDVIHIKEVLANILNNAADSIENAGKITIYLYVEKKNFVIAIEDNGSGIKQADLPHILEPFWSTKRNSSKNYGLGLTYCSNVMSKYGTLNIKSEWGKGTTVFLNFSGRKIVNIKKYDNSGEVICRQLM